MQILLDLGGGTRPLPGHINVDQVHGADCRLDLEKVGYGVTLPFDDDSVDGVYSSHCFEHLDPYRGLLIDIVRVCKLGAPVQIRVPHWGSPMSFIAGHKTSISEDQVRHWREFADDWWGDSPRWLSEPTTEYVRSNTFDEAKRIWPHLTDHQMFRFIQGTCHEIRYRFVVEER